HGNQEMPSLRFLKQTAHVVTQLMNCKPRCVQNMIRYRPNWRQKFPLGRNSVKHRLVGSDGMWTPRLTETPNQSGVGCFQKPERHIEARIVFQLLVYCGKVIEVLT